MTDGDFSKVFFTSPDSTYQDRDLTSRPKNLKNFSKIFIKANFEILTSDLEARPKIRVPTKKFKKIKKFKIFIFANFEILT